MNKPVNECGSCGYDFTSVTAFDRHRTGVHQYTHEEGLRLDPPRQDGRRCMTESEIRVAGMTPDRNGRWHIVLSAEDRARLERLRIAA